MNAPLKKADIASELCSRWQRGLDRPISTDEMSAFLAGAAAIAGSKRWEDVTAGGMPVEILVDLMFTDMVGTDGIAIVGRVFWGGGWNIETWSIIGTFRKDGRISGFDLVEKAVRS